MAQGWTPGEAGAVLFCRPLGGFFVSTLISRYMKRPNPALHWVIRVGSMAMIASGGEAILVPPGLLCMEIFGECLLNK
jgi:hypothetical protein